jgi:hypothetical protein
MRGRGVAQSQHHKFTMLVMESLPASKDGTGTSAVYPFSEYSVGIKSKVCWSDLSAKAYYRLNI